ncbi:MAG: EAL domain-containing protein [Magnetospirillum sp. WYHS-4]
MPDTISQPPPALKSERDRFVALAFCWADMILELDEAGVVQFSGGVVDAVLGRQPDDLKGLGFGDLVLPADRPLVAELLDAARHRGRIENVSIRLQGIRGPTAPLQFAGYFLPDLNRHFFLSFRVGPPAALRHPERELHRDTTSGLYRSDTFSEIACEALGATPVTRTPEAKDAPRALTLIQLDGFSDLQARLQPDAHRQLERTIGACLKAHAVDGDAAGVVAPGRYSLVHTAEVDVGDLEDKIANYARAADPEERGVDVGSATIAVDTHLVSEQDLATGLLHVINRFRKNEGPAFTLKKLSNNLSSLVGEAVRAVDLFKNLVLAGEFGMRFQPINHVETGRAHHFEVLASFPTAIGQGSPYRYITFAEETGLICDFDMAMVLKALDWLARENRLGRYRIAVNLSGHSIGVLSFVDELHRQLAQNTWAQRSLIFEITESARIHDLDAANRFIQSLRKRGHEVCLDDFGAGAANFQYLSALEVDVVKLDGEALKQAIAGPRGRAFLKALATLCTELGVDIIAEMVDDLAMFKFVKDCGIRYVQGYLFGKPSEDISVFGRGRRLDWMNS